MKVCPVCDTLFDGWGANCSGKCSKIAYNRRYRQTEHGKEVNQRYYQSDRCKETSAVYAASEAGKDSHRRYSKTEKGKVVAERARVKYQQTFGYKLAQLRYKMSAKGLAWIERHQDTWHGKRDYLIYVLELPCAGCGEVDKLRLECDHILPRVFGGTDDWSNLQVLCEVCHNFKSVYHDIYWCCAFRRREE